MSVMTDAPRRHQVLGPGLTGALAGLLFGVIIGLAIGLAIMPGQALPRPTSDVGLDPARVAELAQQHLRREYEPRAVASTLDIGTLLRQHLARENGSP